jgi:hypothetical protein
MWDAAVALSENKGLGTCKRCGKELQYRIDHTYANDPDEKEYTFVVTGAVRVGARLADGENCDAFLLVLRDTATGKEHVLPTFWAFGHTGAPRGGYTSPILTLDEWRRLFKKLEPEDPMQRIRERAYQLYEQRGHRAGHDVEDWLVAETEIMGRGRALAAAA